MTFTINLWYAPAVVATLACWVKAASMPYHGEWDFMTPFFKLALYVVPVIAWVAFLLGRSVHVAG